MDILDDVEMGVLVDEESSEDSQTDLNEFLLYEHDKRSLLESISKRISKYDLEFLINRIYLTDVNYWLSLSNEIIKVYNLNPIKTKIAYDFTGDVEFSKLVRDLLIFLKYRLVSILEQDKLEKSEIRINIDTLMDDLLGIIKSKLNPEETIPFLFSYAITFIDRESYKKFLIIMLKEPEMDISE